MSSNLIGGTMKGQPSPVGLFLFGGSMGLNQKTSKLVRSLGLKKFRDETGLFIAEGEKLLADLINAGLKVHTIAATDSWQGTPPASSPFYHVTPDEMKALSSLDTPSPVLGIFQKPQQPTPSLLPPGLILALDGIQNPGNLGTILRTADWFGIHHVYCGEGTADGFSPKAVQATMGALARVNLYYQPLDEVLSAAQSAGRRVSGSFLNGENLYEVELAGDSILILGSEGQGIRPQWEKYISQRLTIPTFPPGRSGPESLNVGLAAGILISEFRRCSITG